MDNNRKNLLRKRLALLALSTGVAVSGFVLGNNIKENNNYSKLIDKLQDNGNLNYAFDHNFKIDGTKLIKNAISSQVPFIFINGNFYTQNGENIAQVMIQTSKTNHEKNNGKCEILVNNGNESYYSKPFDVLDYGNFVAYLFYYIEGSKIGLPSNEYFIDYLTLNSIKSQKYEDLEDVSIKYDENNRIILEDANTSKRIFY